MGDEDKIVPYGDPKSLDPDLGGNAEFSKGVYEIAAMIKVHSPLRSLSETMAPAPNGPSIQAAIDYNGVEAMPPRKLANGVISRLRAGSSMTLEESNLLADLLEGLLDPDAKHYDLSAVRGTLVGRYKHRRRQVAEGELPDETVDRTVEIVVDHWNADATHALAGILLLNKDDTPNYQKLHDWLKHPNG